MAKRSGGTRTGSSGNPLGLNAPAESNILSSKVNNFLNLVQSGAFDEMDEYDARRLLNSLSRESTLTDKRGIYTDDEWDAIDAYGGNAFDWINEEAARPGSGDARTRKFVRDLDTAMKRRTLSKEIVVFRGSEQEETGNRGHFVSTTLSPKVADKFRDYGPNLHAYLIPKGTNYIYVTNKGEDEVLLPRGFDLRRHKIK